MKYYILIALLIVLILVALKQFRSKEKRKYRDLFILVTLLLVFLVGIQVNEYEVGKVNQSNSSQMLAFMENISKNQEVSKSRLAVNSKYIKDEMLIEVDDKIYQINMNTDLSSYKLEETFLINDKINLVKE